MTRSENLEAARKWLLENNPYAACICLVDAIESETEVEFITEVPKKIVDAIRNEAYECGRRDGCNWAADKCVEHWKIGARATSEIIRRGPQPKGE